MLKKEYLKMTKIELKTLEERKKFWDYIIKLIGNDINETYKSLEEKRERFIGLQFWFIEENFNLQFVRTKIHFEEYTDYKELNFEDIFKNGDMKKQYFSFKDL